MAEHISRELIKKALAEGRGTLLEPEGKLLVSSYGIDIPGSVLIRNEGDLEPAVRRLTPPFVLKVVSPEISHKSDVGGVVTGLRDVGEIQKALKAIKKNISGKAPKANIKGFLLEETAPEGVEVIIGGIRDMQFGPAVMFGVGGVAVELMKDVSYRLAPLTKEEVLGMMKELQCYPLLTGFRGSKAVDLDALSKTIISFSDIMTEIKEVREIEINPLIAHEKGVMAVDVRVSLG